MKKLFFYFVPLLIVSCHSAEEDHDEARYLQLGQEISAKSFAALSGELQSAMKRGGVPEAIDYCSLQAYSLTDSLSQTHEASIRRTALRYRNPLNCADTSEMRILRNYEKAIEANKQPEPFVQFSEQVASYYQPILLGDLCLKCHGVVGVDIDPAHYELIKDKYPNDKATGFKTGELRGMWHIDFRLVDSNN